MKFDEPVAPATRTQFATQIGHLTPTQIQQVHDCLEGKQCFEFYEGLLAGFAGAHQILALPNGFALLKVTIAVIAHEMARKELSANKNGDGTSSLKLHGRV